MVLPSKPLAEIYRIADIFNSYGNWSRAEKNTLIPLRDGEICIIRGGQFSLMRQSAGCCWKKAAPRRYWAWPEI